MGSEHSAPPEAAGSRPDSRGSRRSAHLGRRAGVGSDDDHGRAERGWLTIQGVGDTNLDPSHVPTLASHGFDFAFERLGGLFLDDDVTVVNLECSPSALGPTRNKEFTFRCDPASLPVARQHGVDVANLSNNHGQDYGVEAMLDGRADVEAAGIAPVGVGAEAMIADGPDRTRAVVPDIL